MEQGFVLLDVDALRLSEEVRGTDLGRDLKQNRSPSDPKPVHVVEMLKRVIFSGSEGNKFLLTNFPISPDQSAYFEAHCCKIAAIVYASANKGEKIVEVPGNMAVATLDAIFQKDFRLKTMREWDHDQYQAFLGLKTDWCLIVGRSFSGKSTLAKELAPLVKGKVISMAALEESVKKTLGTEDEPFEGDVPIEKIEEAVVALVDADRACNEHFTYIFDDFKHKDAEAFCAFACAKFGPAAYWIHACAEPKVAESRWKRKNESEEVPEDVTAEIANDSRAADVAAKIETLRPCMKIPADVSLETLQSNLRTMFSAKVVIVNHEKRLNVDTQCSNLATKYRMLYLSVYQLIRYHICNSTDLGKELVVSKKPKGLSEHVLIAEGINDEHQEAEYSAVHFDIDVVMKVIC